ncbi:hypothetical protein MBAV_002054 [Candidatus Magnetobacterium bavaricum]|uniref:Uncharacterized protein n=1 Tax=Candidatus Magnetobacterium bavaricum TaxID=29290 RepID=A0A0F3GV44_9BACT|nr:hypothetical protein MBAV_002054 [Candidatus Magnetobacterium bavaricum]
MPCTIINLYVPAVAVLVAVRTSDSSKPTSAGQRHQGGIVEHLSELLLPDDTLNGRQTLNRAVGHDVSDKMHRIG